MMKGLRVAFIQLAVGSDKRKNIAAAVHEIQRAKEQGAQLVTLPECFNSPYGTKYFRDYSEQVPLGETSDALSKVAADTGLCIIGGTIPERSGNQLFNTCTVWNTSGNLVAKYRKMHLFDIDIPGKIRFKESDVLSPGNRIMTFCFCDFRIGVGICYDIRFFEMAAIMGRDCSILIYPAAFNMTTGPRHWELLARSRANDLQLYVALVSPARNTTADYVAWGHTMLVNPWAKVEQTLDERPGTLYACIDLNVVHEVRSQIPVRSQRRTDIYETVVKC